MSFGRFFHVYRASFVSTILMFAVLGAEKVGWLDTIIFSAACFFLTYWVTLAFLNRDRAELVTGASLYANLLYKYLLYDSIRHGGYKIQLTKLFDPYELATIRRLGHRAVKEFQAMSKE